MILEKAFGSFGGGGRLRLLTDDEVETLLARLVAPVQRATAARRDTDTLIPWSAADFRLHRQPIDPLDVRTSRRRAVRNSMFDPFDVRKKEAN